MGIDLECPRPLGPAHEIGIEKSLYSAGFDVLNRARLARELRVEFSPPVSIDAIDRRGRIVKVAGFSHPLRGDDEEQPFYLSIALYSRPTTSRDEAQETRIEKLASEVSTCRVTKVERHTNPGSIEWLYNDIAKQTRGWFEQARRAAPGSNARRVDETP